MKAIVYARVSLDRNGERLGVRRQEEDCRKLAEIRGWEVTEVIVDNDTSAAGAKRRPGFERALSLLEDGTAGVIIAWALDRLTRNRPDTVRLIETAQNAEALIALVRGSDLDMSTPAGRLTTDLLAAVARSEIEAKSDRHRRANQQAAAEGRYSGGRRAFGYEADGVTVREDEAEAVREAYQAILDGDSLRRIADRWNAAGFRTPQGPRGGGGMGSAWSGPVLSRTLRNHRYAGLRTYKGEVTAKAEWPALVDEEVWASAHAILQDPSRRSAKGARHLLTGIALCGTCGAAVWAGGSPRGDSNYRCRSGRHVNRKRQPVDLFITQLVLARLQRDDARQLFAPRDPKSGSNITRALEEAAGVRQRMDGLAEAYADGTVTLRQMQRGTERLQVRLAELERVLQTAEPGREAIRALVSAQDVEQAWEALEVDQRSKVVGQLMTIHLDPLGSGNRDLNMERVRVEWAVA